MDLQLTGKCAIVCAASRGLGRATALSLAREGAAVAICARTEGPLLAAAAEIRSQTGARIVPIVADVARAEDSGRVVAVAAAELGGIDILVTNTVGPKSAYFAALSAISLFAPHSFVARSQRQGPTSLAPESTKTPRIIPLPTRSSPN